MSDCNYSSPRSAQAGRQMFLSAIVAPNPLLCESLSRSLQGSAFTIAATASTIEELIGAGLPDDDPILLIIDACDRSIEICNQIERFKQSYPKARVAVLANQCEPAEVTRVLQSGVNGYFATIATCEDFIKSLELVMGGQTILPSEAIARAPAQRPATIAISNRQDAGANWAASLPVDPPCNTDIPQLSDRERRVLRCLAEGSANKVIARECNIAEGTVKVHVKSILRKIKVKNRTQAAIWALNNHQLDRKPRVVRSTDEVKVPFGSATA